MASHPFIHKFSFSYIPGRLLLPTDSNTGLRSCPSIRFHASPLQTPHPARHNKKHGLSVLKILCTLLHLPASRMPAVPTGYNGLSLLNSSSGAAFSYNGASTGRCTSFFQVWYIAPFLLAAGDIFCNGFTVPADIQDWFPRHVQPEQNVNKTWI